LSIHDLDINSGPASVLILEDLAETLVWLKDIVRESFPTSNIQTATSLRAALKLTQSVTFDLVLVDLGLPDGSGQDLIKQIRSTARNTYIVVATIYDDEQHLLQSLRNGANGYLLKDENRETLVEHLRGIAGSRAPVSDRTLDTVISHFNRQGRNLITLTGREEEVLQLIAKGYNIAESAEMLGLSANTVKSYLKSVYGKLGISSRAEATTEAIKRQLIQV